MKHLLLATLALVAISTQNTALAESAKPLAAPYPVLCRALINGSLDKTFLLSQGQSFHSTLGNSLPVSDRIDLSVGFSASRINAVAIDAKGKVSQLVFNYPDGAREADFVLVHLGARESSGDTKMHLLCKSAALPSPM